MRPYRPPTALGVLLAGGVIACAAARTTTESAAPQPTPTVSDSVDKAQAAAFLSGFFQRSTPLVKSGNWLGILQLVDSLQQTTARGPNVRGYAAQLSGTYLSFIGDERGALRAFSAGAPNRAPLDTSSFAGAAPEDAIEAVTRLAADRQAVFVNEAHHVPRHRAFTMALLPRLRAMGFTHLAVETLADNDSTLMVRGYPTRASGFYSNEPVFGDMLRTARQLGFTLVSYESQSNSQDERETGQARHLVERILRDNPRARFIVHAGYQHIDETGLLAGAKPMAVRFRENTGIDPLTVDQTVMSEMADTIFENPRYRWAVRRYGVRTSSALRLADGTSWSARPGAHDVTVVHPRTAYRDGRPDWMFDLPGRRAYTIPSNVCGNVTDCVVQAGYADESDDAVPVDMLRIRTGSTRTLLLPAGAFVLSAHDGSGRELSRRTITH